MRQATNRLILCLLAACSLSMLGCDGMGRPERDAVTDFYTHRYLAACDALRPLAADRKSSDVVLNNLRLGMASLADGDLAESDRSLMRAYEYLTSGGVNAADRTITSTYFYEGVKVWKGEPYEQAMSFYTIAALQMVHGDWENARAAASNSLFSLRDFKAAQQGDDTAVYRAVQSDFALGYLMVAVNYVLMGQPADAQRLFDFVQQLRPDLDPLVQRLRSGGYDTLLLIDGGRGPRKQAYGEDNARVRFVPSPAYNPAPIAAVTLDTAAAAQVAEPVVDTWALAQKPKWWSPETARTIRSFVGTGLLYGGLATTGIGAMSRNRTVALAGLGAAAAGELLKLSARADTRSLEMLPRCVYIVPLTMGPGRHRVHIHFDRDAGADGSWHDLVAGDLRKPRVYSLRMHNGSGLGMPAYSRQDVPLYTLNADFYRPGDRPWILGGADLTPPSAAILAAYHSSGVLAKLSLDGLTQLYRSQGIVFQPGPQGRDPEHDKAALDPALYREITAGGRVLWAPRPGTHAYERITRSAHGHYAAPNPAAMGMIDPANSKGAQP